MSEPDQTSRPLRGKWISRLAIAASIVVLLAASFIWWDHSDYPVPGFGHPRDPFEMSSWPPPVERLGDYLWDVRQKLYVSKSRRLLARRRAKLQLNGSQWYFMVGSPTEPSGVISFNEDGSVQITPPARVTKQPWFESVRFDRVDEEMLHLLNDIETFEFEISFFQSDHPRLLRRIKPNPHEVTISHVFLFPYSEGKP